MNTSNQNQTIYQSSEANKVRSGTVIAYKKFMRGNLHQLHEKIRNQLGNGSPEQKRFYVLKIAESWGYTPLKSEWPDEFVRFVFDFQTHIQMLTEVKTEPDKEIHTQYRAEYVYLLTEIEIVAAKIFQMLSLNIDELETVPESMAVEHYGIRD